ncbi:MAG: hypothetical protein K0R71_203 [Bacillales bacterium]|jgi:hypothetical protein|nr:hypothetical protein [Bacillales bacterium]
MKILKQLYSSITDPKIIATYRFLNLSNTFLYITLLSLFIYLPNAVHTLIDVNSAKNSMISFISDKSNHFEIKNGELTDSTKNSILYFGNESILIDPSKNLESRDAALEHGVTSGFLRDRFFVNQNEVIQEFKYSDLGFKNVSGSQIIDLIKMYYWPSVYISGVISFIFVAIYTIFIITMISLVATPIKSTMSKKLSFEQIWKMTAHAMTIAVLFFFIMDFARVQVEFRFAIKWIATVGVLFLSLKTIPSSKVIDENETDAEHFDLDEFEKDDEDK